MKKNSDVDVSVIVNNDESLKLLNELQIKYRHSNKLNFEFSGYSIEELRTGKLSKSGKTMRTGPARFTRLIPSYKLIYGEKINLKEMYSKKNIDHLKNVVKLFYDMFFPNYESKKLTFEDIVKQAFWLFELELSVKNKNFEFSTWNEMTNYFDKNHLIQEVILSRNTEKTSKNTKNEFITKLKKYVENLDKEINNKK